MEASLSRALGEKERKQLSIKVQRGSYLAEIEECEGGVLLRGEKIVCELVEIEG